VFNGPVFADDDPPYRQGFWLPRAFWKVIAVPDGDVVRALGFRLEQAEQLADIGREAFAPDELAGYMTAQVPVREIEAQNGLDLGPLAEQDVLPAAPESVGRPVLRSEADIVLG
jgi:endonuclease G